MCLITDIVEFCDSVSGAESEDYLRHMQDVLSLAGTVVGLTIYSRHERLNGDINIAVSLEKQAESARYNLWKLSSDT